MDSRIRAILGPEADDLLDHQCRTISRDVLHLPGPAFVDEVVSLTDRSRPGPAESAGGVRSRPAGRDRVSLDPSRGPGDRAFGRVRVRTESALFRSGEYCQTGRRGTVQRRRSTLGVLGAVSPQVRGTRIPFLVKINHNELLSYPNTLRPASVRLRGTGL